VITGLEVALLVVTGAVLSLDRWPVLQTMASRPLVAGPLVGIILGDVAQGVLWGAVFEIAFLGLLPVGAARYPNETIAAVVGTTVAILGARSGATPAGWAVAAGLVAGWAGERADHLHRRWNGRLVVWARNGLDGGDPDVLGRAVAGGVAGGFVLGAATTAGSMAFGLAGLALVGGTVWAGPVPDPTLRMVVLAGAAAFAGHLFDPRVQWASWMAGALAGGGMAWAVVA